jgi:hypothetical protein
MGPWAVRHRRDRAMTTAAISAMGSSTVRVVVVRMVAIIATG